ncbi:PhnD/SsuA/transferrin family substrate-binding protein [Haloechinothrix sp. YIM 98757]|uniref:PhnD/SsuA/transferrin family substrate-binding protein n=1 Tax=Haloechinothrix aidingensis TaxID=2752311 RepID=A0A838A7A6_9PSEU|nr:PhnD/SsuA/transferrin family substrate-binding protein [Haloechinothrix aidingensis]MBA0124377.1 PhnD/SsuA/transferrin family substrate-binding protein [Haloechinothrix aidingensis]
MTLVLGAVAHDPKVVTVWSGLRTWLRERGLPVDFVLYSHYELQVEELVAGNVHVAWNSPLAWIRTERLANAAGRSTWPLVMRDSDQDLTSVILVRRDSPYEKITDLTEHTIGLGAVDSPQASLLPRALLRESGLVPGENVTVRHFDEGVGLHGNDDAGERAAAAALLAGSVDAAAVIDLNHLIFTRQNTLPPRSTRVLTRTAPYDLGNLTVGTTAPTELIERLRGLLLSMNYANPVDRPHLDLQDMLMWRHGRTCGYQQLAASVDAEGFYSTDGAITAEGYRP